MREPLKISEERLRACLQDHYGLMPVTLDFLPFGQDTYAGVYRVVDEQGTAFLLKVTSRSLYEPGCLIPRYLHDQGITSVVAPILARSGALWVNLEEWIVTVYPFLEGETSWTGVSHEQWKEVGTIFQRIHQIRLPSSDFESLRKETFDPTEYAQWIRTIETQHVYAHNGVGPSQQTLRTSWIAHQATLHEAVAILETLGKKLRRQTSPYVVCHADLHPANLLRDQHGHVFVIDWDEVMLAPKERDFLFIQVSSADSATLPGSPAFFEGYGQTHIDWTVLAYYRYERAVQDLIAWAQDVFFRDDVEEETRAEAVQFFQENLAQDGEIDVAAQTFHHLSL